MTQDTLITVNIYALTVEKASDQKLFGEYLLSVLVPYVGLNIIICGDFNICVNNMQPSSNHTVTYYDCLIQLFQTLAITDIWRLCHLTTKC